MAKLQPPYVNGLMELTEEKAAEITAKLQEIQANFEETDEQPVCDIFYLVSTYNKKNDFKINGDTAEMLLTPAPVDDPGQE